MLLSLCIFPLHGQVSVRGPSLAWWGRSGNWDWKQGAGVRSWTGDLLKSPAPAAFCLLPGSSQLLATQHNNLYTLHKSLKFMKWWSLGHLSIRKDTSITIQPTLTSWKCFDIHYINKLIFNIAENVMDKTNAINFMKTINKVFFFLRIQTHFAAAQHFAFNKWLIECRVSIAACSAGTGWVKNLGESRNKNLHFIGAETLKHFHFYLTDVLPTPPLSLHALLG